LLICSPSSVNASGDVGWVLSKRLVLLTLEIRLLTAKPMAYFEVDE
jgi:hypothetical protein